MAAPSKKVFILIISIICLSDMCVLNVKGAGSFVTTPPAIGGVLTSCGETRLTCSHNNVGGENTRWRITRINSSMPVCEVTINHLNPTPVQPYSCGEFRFQDVTELPRADNDLNSTAVVSPLPLDLSGSQMECIAGSVSTSPSVGNVTLCVIDGLSPPTDLACENTTNGLNVSWEAANDTLCTMNVVEYLITVIKELDMTIITSMTSPETAAELSGTEIVLEPGTSYIISVGAIIPMTSCGGESTNITCETSPSLPTQSPGTSPPTESSQTSTSPSGPSTASLSTEATVGIVIGVIGIVILVIMIVIVIVIFTVIKKPRDGKDDTDQGVHVPLANDTEQKQLPLYAMVDKSQKTVAEQPTYQDPSSIQHETAPTGDVYAVTDKQQKKKGPTEAELAQMYSVPDKTKGGGLNYASLDMPADGNEAKSPAPTEYATVIN